KHGTSPPEPMSAAAYKPTQTHGGTLQGLRVWQRRLDDLAAALERGERGGALTLVEDLRQRLAPEAFPEFAANLDWLYRSIAAHLEKGLTDEARAIVGSLQRLLELAAERLIAERGAGSIPPPA
ncbi:MAG: hypothetical protein ACLFU2_03200, partial [Opitutales bacterium]